MGWIGTRHSVEEKGNETFGEDGGGSELLAPRETIRKVYWKPDERVLKIALTHSFQPCWEAACLPLPPLT